MLSEASLFLMLGIFLKPSGIGSIQNACVKDQLCGGLGTREMPTNF